MLGNVQITIAHPVYVRYLDDDFLQTCHLEYVFICLILKKLHTHMAKSKKITYFLLYSLLLTELKGMWIHLDVSW